MLQISQEIFDNMAKVYLGNPKILNFLYPVFREGFATNDQIFNSITYPLLT